MKKLFDLSLYLVTDRGSLSLDEFFKKILEAVHGGVTMVQLREKDTEAREFIKIGKKLHLLLKPLNIPLIINDRVDIALEIGAEGVHLGQSDMKPSTARKILGKEAIIGLSVETMEQAHLAVSEEIDYIAASPVFSTKTKTDCKAPWELTGLRKLCDVSKHPVVAIGGICEANAKNVIDCGSAGIAVVSAIFKAKSPKSAAEALINQVKGYAVSSFE